MTTMTTPARKSSRRRPSRSPQPRRKSRPNAPTIPCACICARWARSELLSREGEIAIAKRIEAGREAMIAGLCESPLTFQAIIIWRDELNEGKVFLRDIIDLEATYAGPDAKQMQPPVIGPDGKPIMPAVGTPVPGAPHLQVVQTPAPPAAPPAATPFKAPGTEGDEERRRIRARPLPRAITTKTIWRIRFRSPPSRPS